MNKICLALLIFGFVLTSTQGGEGTADTYLLGALVISIYVHKSKDFNVFRKD